jgi:hypothetical protein
VGRHDDKDYGVYAGVLALSRACVRACALVQLGRQSLTLAGGAHGLDRESRGVRPLECMRSHLCRRRRRGHGGDTKPTARAQRRHRDKSTTSRFRRVGVQGRGGQKGSNLGSMARRTHVRQCVGVRGDGTAECRARSQIGEAGARPLGCVRSCACRTPTARPWRRHETDGVH